MADPSRGAAASSASNAEVEPTFVGKKGLELPGYRLIEVIGRGAMGEVWRAEQISLARQVALKLLPEHLSTDPEFVTRFDKEATALAALSHPHIVQIIDRGAVDGRYFFAMELVQGRSLRDRLGQGALSCVETLRIVRQLCQAIACAHDHGVVHRDLKPENILLDERGNVKVADFGLAGFRGSEAGRMGMTATSVAMGTLNYMAPEQRKDAKNVDGRADLYSLGVVFYELLTHDLPLGRFRSPSERVQGLDPRLDAVVLQLLEPEVATRTASAQAVEAALIPLLAALESSPSFVSPASSLPSSSGARTSPSLSQARATIIHRTFGLVRTGLLALGALCVLALLAWSVLGFSVKRNGTELDLLRHGQVVFDLDRHQTLTPAVAADEAAARGAMDRVLNVSGHFSSANQTQRLAIDFGEGGGEALHAFAGDWRVEKGQLHARQRGDGPGGPLIPRAYVDGRIFSTQGFDAAVTLAVQPLENVAPTDPQYAELALRFTRLQISVFADLDTGMRVSWKYRSESGKWLKGTTTDAIADGTEDEVHLPKDRPSRLELSLEARPKGMLLSASLDGRPFAKRMLEGLRDAPGKVALGCRNLECTFSALSVTSAPPQNLPPRADHEGEE